MPVEGSHLNPDTTRREDSDIDESPTLAEQQVLHRVLPDQSGQDYFVQVPGGGRHDGPVFVAVHGISRNAREQAQAFASDCEQHGALLVAPHFSAERYPNYQRLGRSRNPADRRRGADQALMAILDDVARLTGVSIGKIHLFGFGTGARFVMRFAMAYPGRVAGAVMTTAEAFTFPDPDRGYPAGIAPAVKRRDLAFRPEEFLRVPMTVLEGSRREGPAGPRRASDVASREKARSWVTAMRGAAATHHLEPLVVYREVDAPLGTFAPFVRDAALRERVFEALLYRAPAGLPAVIPAEGVLEHAADIRDWPVLRGPFDEPAAAPAAAASRGQRLALPATMVAILLAVVTPFLVWLDYRSDFVVAREAIVRSHIANVGARVDGVIKSIEVDTGDRVRKGDVIARLEDSHFTARVTQARSQLEKARRELEVERLAIENERQRLSGSLREVSAELAAARASVAASEARADEAARQLELQQSMARQGLVPAERVRTAETELRTARALVAESRADLAASGAGEDLARVASSGIRVREKRVSVLESDIATYEAELALMEANLEATLIRAPDDGAVVRRIVQPGGSITVGQPIVALWAGEKIWVEAWLDEDDLGSIGPGSPATVTFKSHPDREFTGVVETIGVSTDVELPDSAVPQSRQERMRVDPVIGVRIRLDDTGVELLPGLSAAVGIRKRGG